MIGIVVPILKTNLVPKPSPLYLEILQIQKFKLYLKVFKYYLGKITQKNYLKKIQN